jgi:uncharacterized protein YbdZ (MbtH family)
MTDPLDGEDGSLLDPASHEGQHSLRPATICGSADWTIAYPVASRAASLDYVGQ